MTSSGDKTGKTNLTQRYINENGQRMRIQGINRWSKQKELMSQKVNIMTNQTTLKLGHRETQWNRI